MRVLCRAGATRAVETWCNRDRRMCGAGCTRPTNFDVGIYKQQAISKLDVSGRSRRFPPLQGAG